MSELKISSKCEKDKFKEFLLSLNKKTLENFTYFGNISKKNVGGIILSELSNNKKNRFFVFLEK